MNQENRHEIRLADTPLIFIMGPTASGKSGLALSLAQHFPFEIVNADSIQVYRRMDIGSAKPSPEEQAQVPHHLLDVVEPDDPFSAARYRDHALEIMTDCHKRGVIPLFVGGTGLYLRALSEGLAPIPPVDPQILTELQQRGQKEGWPTLHNQLAQHDPDAAQRLPPNDGQRISRALSVFLSSGNTLTYWQNQQHPIPKQPILKLAPFQARETLYARIEKRFDQMIAMGFMDEARMLLERGYDRSLPAMKAVGYRQAFLHLDGKLSLQESIELGKRDSRRYAKRQLTWLRSESDLVWITDQCADTATSVVDAFIQSGRMPTQPKSWTNTHPA
ncbi:MAG: tRNA (adenosine(37)-N6)-dimethylallyltransferase MiaA [Magnetococcales bacterium]|nr:tRNA (adenosine(37)-N6)-dimethylallyltransferase MiaA [Magnetococcales bacterium]